MRAGSRSNRVAAILLLTRNAQPSATHTSQPQHDYDPRADRRPQTHAGGSKCTGMRAHRLCPNVVRFELVIPFASAPLSADASSFARVCRCTPLQQDEVPLRGAPEHAPPALLNDRRAA